KHQQVIGHVCGGRPYFLAVENPATVAADGLGAHRSEQVGAAAGFSESNRCAQAAFSDFGQEFLLLLLGAVDGNRFRAGERGDTPDPGQATEAAREFAAENHLRDDVAALSAVFLANTDTMEAGFAKFVPQGERVIVLVFSELTRP